MKTTQHYEKRAQQRGIPPVVIDWVLDYGTEEFDHHGAIIHFFDRDGRRRLEKAVGRQVVSKLEPYLDVYAVEDTNGQLITVGHRFQRINRAA